MTRTALTQRLINNNPRHKGQGNLKNTLTYILLSRQGQKNNTALTLRKKMVFTAQKYLNKIIQ